MNDVFEDVVCESSFLARKKPLKGVDVIVIVINYLEFKSIDLEFLNSLSVGQLLKVGGLLSCTRLLSMTLSVTALAAIRCLSYE